MMIRKCLVALACVTVVGIAPVLQADAATKKKERPRAETSQSLDGRTTGRPRTCGYDTFVYDGFGVPVGPYCH